MIELLLIIIIVLLAIILINSVYKDEQPQQEQETSHPMEMKTIHIKPGPIIINVRPSINGTLGPTS